MIDKIAENSSIVAIDIEFWGDGDKGRKTPDIKF